MRVPKRDLPGHRTIKQRRASGDAQPAGLGRVVEELAIEGHDRHDAAVYAREVVELDADEPAEPAQYAFAVPASDGLLRWFEDAVFPGGVAPGRSAIDTAGADAAQLAVNDPLFTSEVYAFLDKYVQ